MKVIAIQQKTDFSAKAKSALVSTVPSIANTMIMFFAPIFGLLFIVALAVTVDTSISLWKVKKLKQKFSWTKLIVGLLSKSGYYLLFILLLYTADRILLNELTKQIISIDFICTKIFAFVLTYMEAKSMDKHFKQVKGYSFIDKIAGNITELKNIKDKI